MLQRTIYIIIRHSLISQWQYKYHSHIAQMIANGAIMDLNCFLKFMILVMIILFVGFLAWIQNKVANSNEVNNNTQRDEFMQVSDEINLFFEQDHDDNTISNGLSEYCACSFCGKLSKIITTCTRCKNAIYWYVPKILFHSPFFLIRISIFNLFLKNCG